MAVKQRGGKKFRAKLSRSTKKHAGKMLAAVTLGKLGGKKGGPARAKKLAPSQRSAIAKKGGKARWK